MDAFTASLFSGNPAAVCLLDSSSCKLDDQTRQKVAAEMNLSETAFVEGTNFATAMWVATSSAYASDHGCCFTLLARMAAVLLWAWGLERLTRLKCLACAAASSCAGSHLSTRRNCVDMPPWHRLLRLSRV